MNKTILKALMICCVIVSCKTKGIEDPLDNKCELFKIGNYEFFNPRIYDRPVLFEKESHNLLHEEYTPIWYKGYCAVNLPSHFSTKEDYLKYVHSGDIKRFGTSKYETIYDENKTNTKGIQDVYHKDFHLLFRGTVSVKNVASGNEYLLVAGKSYIASENDYDKNTEFYESEVKNMFAFMLEDGIYKHVSVDLVVGTFTKHQHEQVYDILNAKTLVDALCFETINTIKKPDFDSAALPKWVYNKSESDQ
ncbi:hypothetical protein [uncultured Algibacter sp.]|uniref:hypothetical protein n=1 Tax=uncultured Algibacter sp. TaxID=298659 RepID=UPI0032170B99